ncbi:MAG TPA: hypothetical protein VK797_06660 [Tepidisphaeraceae bacterium]|jgi:hypothetical protein|nr:hypothetical protein [Tepidisphaeraceae bacterium]
MNLLAEVANAPLPAWQTYYEIVGASAGTLIGLQFVVIALLATTRKRADRESINAFGTPTVVHFGGALAVCAMMAAPWPSLLALSVALTACGVGALSYAAKVFHRARQQTAYQPVWEDWLWHAILPCGVYAAFTAAALLLRVITQIALFVIAGAAIGLLFIGIRNAWDSVIYIVVADDGHDAAKSE